MTAGSTCTWTAPDAATARVLIVGELEFATARLLLQLVTEQPLERARPVVQVQPAARAGDRAVDQQQRRQPGGVAKADPAAVEPHFRVVGLPTLTGMTAYLTGETADSRARLDS